MQRTIDDLKLKSKTEIDRLLSENSDLKESLRVREEETDSSVREKDDELKSLKNMFDKEMAIFKQKVEFKEVQNQQLKSQLDESRKNHDNMVKAIENRAKESHDGKESAFKQVERLKEEHALEISELERQFSETRLSLETQVESLNERNNDLDLKYKLLKAEYEKDSENLRSQLETSEHQRVRAMEQSKSLDSQKLRLLEEAE